MQSLRDELRALPVLSCLPHPFDPSATPNSPQPLFIDWFRAAVAAGEEEPHAMTLSTCDREGRPDARVLILKDLDDEGWWFATDSASSKSRTSQPLADAAECRRAVALVRKTLEADPEMVSPTWALYAVHPKEVEFWQADQDRLHTRLRYSRTESGWQGNLLWP